MGLLDWLTGREKNLTYEKVLTYEIVFGDSKDVGVAVRPLVAWLPEVAYVQLWACYEAKIIYNLGYPDNMSALMALGAVASIVQRDVDATTDCFQRAGLDDVMTFTPQAPRAGVLTFTGEFYAKGSFERMIQTHFPKDFSEQQVVYSGLALMQYAVWMNRGNVESLDVLTKTARHMVAFYESGVGGDVVAAFQIPTLAYMKAIGAS